MNRNQMIEVVEELIDVLNKRKVSPVDAKSIANIFEKTVNESNDAGIQKYMKTAVFCGSPPEI